METVFGLQVEKSDWVQTLQGFVGRLLEAKAVAAVMVPKHRPTNGLVMPALITDSEQAEGVDPLSPCFPLNAARIAARLSRKPMGKPWAAVLRPCEVRALVELVKLKQARLDELVLISFDCPGAFSNKDYLSFCAERQAGAVTGDFLEAAFDVPEPPVPLTEACRSCQNPAVDNVDIHIGLFGCRHQEVLPLTAYSQKGRRALEAIELEEGQSPAGRQDALQRLLEARTRSSQAMFQRTRSVVADISKAAAYFANCVNCYNCRVACPVCYCKECVFNTDALNYEPYQYLKWSQKAGAFKLPADTLFFHLTRLAHMSTACVGCGQCSNACPNDIGVMEVFRTVAHHTQQAFGYHAGTNPEEPPPLTTFRETEFPEVVGIGE